MAWKKRASKIKIISIIGFCAMLAAVFQLIYCQLVYHEKEKIGATCDVVLVYGGILNRSVVGLSLANKAHVPIFISEAFGGTEDVKQKIGPVDIPVTVDHFARTTDQNARNAVQFIKHGRYKRVVLVTDWYHQPRALFLTRLYLLGSGVRIHPIFFEPIPSRWWAESEFWTEIVRFWGSLGRVVLAALGFEKPWFHS